MLAFKAEVWPVVLLVAFVLSHESYQRQVLDMQNGRENNLRLLKMELSEQWCTSCFRTERYLQIQTWEISESHIRINFFIFLFLCISVVRNEWLVNWITLLPRVCVVCEWNVQPVESILSLAIFWNFTTQKDQFWESTAYQPLKSHRSTNTLGGSNYFVRGFLVGFFCCYLCKWAP